MFQPEEEQEIDFPQQHIEEQYRKRVFADEGKCSCKHCVSLDISRDAQYEEASRQTKQQEAQRIDEFQFGYRNLPPPITPAQSTPKEPITKKGLL